MWLLPSENLSRICKCKVITAKNTLAADNGEYVTKNDEDTNEANAGKRVDVLKVWKMVLLSTAPLMPCIAVVTDV